MASNDGKVTDQLIELHRALALGGVGLSIIGHAFVHARGQSLPNQTGIHHDSMLDGLERLTRAVHDADGLVFAQLAHAGSQSGMRQFDLLAPSSIPNALTGRTPRAASEDEIEEVISAFGDAARRAVDAGFDGVHIHAANGYLLSAFQSPHANHRTDAWGGDASRRSALTIRVVKSVREAVGPNVPVTLKMGMVDQIEGGVDVSESVRRVVALARSGLDGVEVSCGVMAAGTDSCHKYVAVDSRRAASDHLYHRLFSQPASEAYFEPYALAIRAGAPRLALFLVGGLRSTETIERVLAGGSCDFVCLARPLIREPDLVSQIEAGRRGLLDCTSCNLCLENEGDHALQCWRTPRTRLARAAVLYARRRIVTDRG